MTSKKRKGTFLTSKKKVLGVAPSEKRKHEQYWILWKVHFPHIEFCEESVFLMLNFVKCLKTDSIFFLDRTFLHNRSIKKIRVTHYIFQHFSWNQLWFFYLLVSQILWNQLISNFPYWSLLVTIRCAVRSRNISSIIRTLIWQSVSKSAFNFSHNNQS